MKVGVWFLSVLCFAAAARRYEVAGWLRSTLGAMGTKDMPAEPSEEEFIFALRNGTILCHVLNKIQPGVIPKVCFCCCMKLLLFRFELLLIGCVRLSG